MSWGEVVVECKGGVERCVKALERFFESMCGDRSLCEEPPSRAASRRSYLWVEKLIEAGVPDGRARLILYVISRYLVNIKGLEPEEAERVIGNFIENSCRNHGNCSKVYGSWIRRVVDSVSRGGWKPWSIEALKKRDPQLYDIVSKTVKLEE
ncbi:MAG: DNA primase noncatalytic subunit PriX [Thermoprotei archaeon]|nr:DNA primase noncatalytic subunit PriX [Thermoprotei archaeon]